MEISFWFAHALPYGLGLSLVISIVLLGSIWFNPEIMLNDYPPDVKAVYGPARNPNSIRQGRALAILMLILTVGILTASLVSLPRPTGGFGTAYLAGLVTIWTVLMVFNLFDLLVLDFPLVLFQPTRMILPGTEGMPGYRSYWFHVRGFLIGTVGLSIASFFLALIPAVAWII